MMLFKFVLDMDTKGKNKRKQFSSIALAHSFCSQFQ